MAKLSEWDASDLEDIRRREARYRELSDQLIAYAKADALMPAADFDELHQLESALAGDVKKLLSIVEQLQG